MSVHLHAQLEIAPGKMRMALSLLRDEVIPAMEGQGWKLIGCFTCLSGPRNVIIDLWELDDLEHFRRGYQVFKQEPQFAEVHEKIAQCVAKETLTFLERALP